MEESTLKDQHTFLWKSVKSLSEKSVMIEFNRFYGLNGKTLY